MYPWGQDDPVIRLAQTFKIYLLYFLNVSQNRVKSQWRNGSFHFHIHFCFIAKQRWNDGQTLIFKTHTYIERRRRREREKRYHCRLLQKAKSQKWSAGGDDVPGQTHKQHTRGRSIRMQLGFLTHIMFLNNCTLHTPNSWMLIIRACVRVRGEVFLLLFFCFHSNSSNRGLQYCEVIPPQSSGQPPTAFLPSAVKWSLTACLLRAGYCISLTATIQASKLEVTAPSPSTAFIPPTPPSIPSPPFCQGFVLKGLLPQPQWSSPPINTLILSQKSPRMIRPEVLSNLGEKGGNVGGVVSNQRRDYGNAANGSNPKLMTSKKKNDLRQRFRGRNLKQPHQVFCKVQVFGLNCAKCFLDNSVIWRKNGRWHRQSCPNGRGDRSVPLIPPQNLIQK